MKPPKIFKSLTPLVIAAILLSFAAPASTAQRRRTRTRSAQRTRRTTPRAAPAQTQIPPRPAAVSTQPSARGAQPPNPDGVAPPRAADEAGADVPRGPQDERTFEEMVGADTYGAYIELRRVGTLGQANELKTAAAGIKLFDEAELKSVTDLLDFVTANYEPLAEARFVMLFMSARPRVPVAISALEFPSARDAAAFEPKYRQFADDQLKTYKAKYQTPKPSAGRRATAAERAQQKARERQQDALDYTMRRVGRVIVTAEKGLSLKRLRGEESAPSLADSPRFQNARTRFSSDSFFVYVDTGVMTRGYTRMVGEAQAGLEDGSAGRADASAVGGAGEAEIGVVAPVVKSESIKVEAPPAAETTPETGEGEEGEEEELTEEERKALDAAMAAEAEAVKPSEEQRAVMGMSSVMRGLWSGVPRMPGAFALGARLDEGALVLRLAVENSNDGRVSVIPFLPNFVAGPPVTAGAAEVAPADADIFFTTSLDWEQVYTSTLGSAALNTALAAPSMSVTEEGEGEGEEEPKPQKPEETVAAVEKLFGFKFKEDLIPALGNEVAYSMPFDSGDLFGRSYRRGPKKEEKPKESEAGAVVIVSLNDPDKVRKILPRVLVALGFVPFGDRASQPERREGFEINSAGGFAYSVIDRFLVVSEEASAVRHVIDSYAARRTLASADSYRDATSWQAPQKLVQAFVSEALMRSAAEETKRRSGDSTDPLVQALLAQLEAPPQPASLETTNEGDSVVHQLRIPVPMLQTYALSIAVSIRDQPVLSGESAATYVLYEVESAETTFKVEKKKGRYATLEELVAEKILDKGFGEHPSYRIEINAAGEKFEVTATPKDYGKTGRRSFFLDETGTLRAADHKGKPATASDPPVD